jgi:adenosylcobalamin-dependent ribonucleoside-triphosphate reductase
MKGSGVGRSYDSDIHFVNWDYMPNCRFVLSSRHPDYQDWLESKEEAEHKYDSESDDVRWFSVDDSAEGWAKMVMVIETAAFHKNNQDTTFVFDFTSVRASGTPILGQQNRPASGPVPLMKAMHQVARLKGLGWKPWKQALFVDHYISECVRLGGVRRSSRIACKYWKDKDVIDFIDIKRGGWLWTANNSILVDEEFWEQAKDPRPSHGRRVFEAAVAAAYYDETGEPGFINIDKLTWNNEGIEDITVDNYLNKDYHASFGGFHRKTLEMIDYTLEKAKKKQYPFIVNPCAEIVKAIFGSYCIVGDACLAYARTKQDARDAARMMAQALVRTNLMKFLYEAETKRTNRIGVSFIGIYEFMWNIFGINFHEAVTMDEIYRNSAEGRRYLKDNAVAFKPVHDFWNFMRELEQIVDQEVTDISKVFGLKKPHTFICLKPGGTTPKVMNCTEAANAPAMDFYLRWVQFRAEHPGLKEFADRGYPVRDVSRSEQRVGVDGKEYTVNGYPNTHIVGFPTKMQIAEDMGDLNVTASDITLEQNFAWLRLLERYLLGGPGKGNQVSITIKYSADKVSMQDFMQMLLDQQKTIRCCAIMPQTDNSAYIYQPEMRITREEYLEYMSKINAMDREAVDIASLDCAGGNCGIDVSQNASITEELSGTLDSVV